MMPLSIVVFGLSLSSSWGNGHATTYRALLKAMAARGHEISFFERDVPWYASNRDLPSPDYCSLVLYEDLNSVLGYRGQIQRADLVIIGSYVAEAVLLAELLRPLAQRLAFYDIDTPVTLAALRRGDAAYISHTGIQLYDMYLSFSAGPSLRVLETEFSARRTAALFCAVDPDQYRPTQTVDEPRWALGYLGTYSSDRQPVLDRLLLEPARRRPDLRFVVAGPQYPADIQWPDNVDRIEHLPPASHADFYNDLCWTLNVTRSDMIAAGYSPSVRLFEASACGTPIISDEWLGLAEIFALGDELVTASSSDDVLYYLSLSNRDRRRIGMAGRARTLAGHTANHRAMELETHIAAIPARELA